MCETWIIANVTDCHGHVHHLLMSTDLNFILFLRATSPRCDEEMRLLSKRKRSEFSVCVRAESSRAASSLCVFVWDVLLKAPLDCVLKRSLLDLHCATERCRNIYHPKKLSLCPASPDQSSGPRDPRLLPPPASLSGQHDQALVAAFVLFPL